VRSSKLDSLDLVQRSSIASTGLPIVAVDRSSAALAALAGRRPWRGAGG